MKKRTAQKILCTENYYVSLVNPENGRECYVPLKKRHAELMVRACQKLKCMEIYMDMVNDIRLAFDTEQ